MSRRSGVSVIEVIIALSIAAVVIAAVGNLVAATHRLTSQSTKEIQATAFAQQWIDQLSAQANQQFGCSCGATNPCAANTCTTGSQSCTPRSGFNSCWVSTPLNTSPFTFTTQGSGWQASDTPATGFSRTMLVTNAQRDANGALVATGGTMDTNSKQITVTVAWTDGTASHQVQQTILLTAWKNF